MRNYTISKLMVAVTVAAFSLAFAVQASAYDFTIGDADPRYLGEIDPATPSDGTSQANYINQLLSMALGSSTTVDGNFFDRSANACAACPMALVLGSVTDIEPDVPVDLGSGYEYIYAKYGGEAHVWYAGGLTGTDHTIPDEDPGGQALSHYALYNPGGQVPEPTTLSLLGSGLAALGVFGRRQFRK